MPVADTKKAQTLINAAAEEAQRIKDAATRLEGLRTLYQTQGVNPAGTPLEGNVTAVSTWIDNVRTVADAAVADAMIAAIVLSHRGEALD